MRWSFLRKYLSLNSKIPDANGPRITDYFEQVILLGRLSGVMPLDNPGLLSKLYYIFMAMNTICVSITGWQFVYCFAHRFDGDLNKVMYILINIPVYVFGSYFILYYQKRSEFLKMMFRFGYENFRFRSARGLTVFTMAPAVRFNKIFIPIFTVSTFLGAYQWVFTATLSTMNGKRQLPLDLDYPFDIHVTPYFEILFTVQVYMQAIIAFNYANMSILFIAFSNLANSQFDILRCSIKNTGYTALLRLGVPHAALTRRVGFKSSTDSYAIGSEEEIDCCYDQIDNKEVRVHFNDLNRDYKLHYDRSETSIENFAIYQKLDESVTGDKVIDAIKDCVEHHLVIREFCGFMEEFFKPQFAVNLTGLCITICFTLYSTADHFELKTMFYLSLSIGMTLIICYMGNQIRLQSERVDLSVFWSGWEEQSARVRRHYLILMQQALRPIRLTGGGLMSLTLDNFLAIMKMAFSFFTLMRNAAENRDGDVHSITF